MADILCGYTADRDETLVAYLYGDIDPAQRAAFDAHIQTCERCGHELAELQGVRTMLREWREPESVGPLTFAATPPVAAGGVPRRTVGEALRTLPAWAQLAAAMLVIGVSAGAANLDVHYDRTGLTVRTGWSRATPAAAAPVAAAAPIRPVDTRAAASPWRGDLDALERRLRTEWQASGASASAAAAHNAAAAPNAAADAQLLRKVHTLLDESERRQRNEMALGLAGVIKEFNVKRGNDLAAIGYLNTQQSATGIEIVRQQGLINYLTTASMKR
jgi:anti-sigma factor RsiW